MQVVVFVLAVEVVHGSVQASEGLTPYARFGDTGVLMLAAGIIAASLLARRSG